MEVQLHPGDPYYSWAGYNDVYADITFTPVLDYPTPLEGKQLLKIEIEPAGCTEIKYEVLDNQYETDLWHVVNNHNDIGAPPLKPVTAIYPESLSNPLIDIDEIAGYFSTMDFGNPLFNPDFPTPDGDYEEYPTLGTLCQRSFLWVEMGDPIASSQITITKLYTGTDIQLETNSSVLIQRKQLTDEISY